MGNKVSLGVLRLRIFRTAPAHFWKLLPRPDITVPARLPRPEVEANRRGECLGFLNARQFLRSPPPSSTAEASRSRHVRQCRLRVGSEGQGTEGSPPSLLPGNRRGPRPWGPNLLLGNRPVGPTLVLSKETDRSYPRA